MKSAAPNSHAVVARNWDHLLHLQGKNKTIIVMTTSTCGTPGSCTDSRGDVTQAMAFEALKADVGRPRGRTTSCRPTSSTSARGPGGRPGTAWWSWTSVEPAAKGAAAESDSAGAVARQEASDHCGALCMCVFCCSRVH